MPCPVVNTKLLDQDVVNVELASPDRRNPLDHGVLDALEDALFSGRHNVVLLSAVPGPAFSAGGDLSLPRAELSRLSARIYSLCRRTMATPTVFIVAAHGIVVAGGAQLYFAADLRVVAPGLKLRAALPDRELCVGSWTLPSMSGRGRAIDLLLTGRELDGAEALAWGLADRIADDPLAAATEIAVTIAALPVAYRARVKQAVAAAAFSLDALDLEERGFTPPTYRKPRERAQDD
jgi:enoyl-CoA hydratase/carnithine racemase